MTTYVLTFGQKYNHDPHPACAKIDGKSFVRIEAEDEIAAREHANALLQNQWAFMYEWDEFEPQIAEYGLWDATRYVMVLPVVDHPLTQEYPDMHLGPYDLEVLAATVYQTRAQSPREIDPARWAEIKRRFPGSVRACYDDVLDMIENGELES